MGGETEGRLEQELLELSEGVMVLDPEWRVVYVNAEQERVSGLPRAQTLGRTFDEIWPLARQHAPTFVAHYERCMRERVTVEFEEHWAPADAWWHIAARPLRDGGIAVFQRDVTARRRAEAALAEQQQLLQSIVDGTPSLIAALDTELRYVLVNEPAARASGHAPASLIGKPVGFGLPPERQAALRARFEEVLRSAEPRTEEIELGLEAAPTHTLATRYPLHGVDGSLTGVASVLTDISAQKRVEQELRASEARARAALVALERAMEVTRHTEEKLRQAQKMEAIGQLAGGVAHDFNNLLTIILGGAEDVLAELPPGPMHEEVLEIEKAGRRAAELTRQLLAFGRKQVLEPRVLDLDELVRGAERLLRRVLGENIELKVDLAPELPPTLIDPGQFEQVLLNLAVNARDAMPDGGNLRIETAEVVVDHAFCIEHPEVTPGPFVRVSVSDTGVGMSEVVRAKIFEPFFTTKEVGRGTGLGLATVYGIVRQSGGTISVESELGRGATFRLYFPRAVGQAVARATPGSHPARTLGRETVLLVEDDERVRASVASMLRRGGLQVILAANGGEALNICENHAGTIHLLLTDVVMPKLNGRKVAERLTASRPGLRVLFMSGYTADALHGHDAGTDFIAKPVTASVLLAKVHEVLSRAD